MNFEFLMHFTNEKLNGYVSPYSQKSSARFKSSQLLIAVGGCEHVLLDWKETKGLFHLISPISF